MLIETGSRIENIKKTLIEMGRLLEIYLFLNIYLVVIVKAYMFVRFGGRGLVNVSMALFYIAYLVQCLFINTDLTEIIANFNMSGVNILLIALAMYILLLIRFADVFSNISTIRSYNYFYSCIINVMLLYVADKEFYYYFLNYQSYTSLMVTVCICFR